MYNKKFYEKYAQLTLELILPYPIENFILVDKPDIQNNIDSIGIEVTHTDQPEHFEMSRYGENCFKKTKDGEIIRNFKGEAFFNHDGVCYAFSTTKGLITPRFFEDIAKTLKKKKQKIDSYKRFQKNGLYCFSEFMVLEDDIKEIQLLDLHPYDFLIVNAYDIIYLIKDKEYILHKITQSELYDFKKKSLEYSKTNA